MKTLLVAMGAILLATPILATSVVARDTGIGAGGHAFTQGYGQVVGLDSVADATFRAVDFNFRSDRIDLCLEDDSAVTYFRFGDSLPTNATSSANFIAGVAGSLPSRAMPLFSDGDGTDVHCLILPVEANGIVLHSAGNATVNVRAYAE